MATQVKFKIEANGENLYVFDTTGAYSSQNQTGWGLPNIPISSVTDAKIVATTPSGQVLEASVFPALPNTSNVGRELTPASFGIDKFTPGVYRFDLIYSLPNNQVLAQSVTFYHHRPLECCITNKKLKLSLTDASSPAAMEVLELETLLENSIWAACAGDLDSTKKISAYIEAKCKCCGC